MSRRSFTEVYCERMGIAASHFSRRALRDSLYLHARPVYPVLDALFSDYSDADRDFIVSVGGITQAKEFIHCLREYQRHPRNKGLLRRLLRIRVSGRRLQQLVEESLHT